MNLYACVYVNVDVYVNVCVMLRTTKQNVEDPSLGTCIHSLRTIPRELEHGTVK